MLIEFVRAWRRAVPEKVVEFHEGAANVLIRRGIAKLHTPQKKHRKKASTSHVD